MRWHMKFAMVIVSFVEIEMRVTDTKPITIKSDGEYGV